MSAQPLGEQLQRIADVAISEALSERDRILSTLAVRSALRDAADVIVDRYTPICVCPEHGGYDVADVVKRIAAMLNDKADRIGTDR